MHSVVRDARGRVVSGALNPHGRPKGSRAKLGEAFLEALHEDFQQFGADAIALCREERPDVYVRIVASLLPKEVLVRSSPLDGMTHEQLQRFAALLESAIEAARQGLPVPPIVLDGEAQEETTPA